MKNVMLVTYDMVGGGCERVIAQLANWFTDNEIKCSILTESKPECFYDLNKKVNIRSFAYDSKNYNRSIIKNYFNLRKMTKKFKPDVIIAMPEKVNVWVALALVGTNIPVIVSERNNPALYPRSKIKRVLRKIIYPFFCKGFVFQTKQASEFFSLGIQKRSIILPNPIDLNRLPQPYTGKRRKEIVAIGRLEEQKNFHLLIDAFSEFHHKYDDYILTIYGEGSLRDKLEQYASKKLPKNSYFLPGKKKNVLDLINQSQMFILTSNYEGMPNVLIEAMALGLPVISTDCPVGGPNELIENMKNGILVPVGDKDGIVLAMFKIVEDENYTKKICTNAILIRQKLEINKIASQLLKYLKDIVV
ncbi:UNVERIFIED_CONTAM: glycosyltransferase involved in cell wall biosynthesis [Acetivibrio alkalicellulosi]